MNDLCLISRTKAASQPRTAAWQPCPGLNSQAEPLPFHGRRSVLGDLRSVRLSHRERLLWARSARPEVIRRLLYPGHRSRITMIDVVTADRPGYVAACACASRWWGSTLKAEDDAVSQGSQDDTATTFTTPRKHKNQLALFISTVASRKSSCRSLPYHERQPEVQVTQDFRWPFVRHGNWFHG